MDHITSQEIYKKLRQALRYEVEKNKLIGDTISVRCKALSAEEAIGKPQDSDYPIIKGKEKMVEAIFRSSRGQAFSDEFGNADYSMEELLELKLDTNRKRADFIACLNSIYRYLGLCDKTVHCRDFEPRECGKRLLEQTDKDKKILLIGLQPRLLESLASRQQVRVIDLDPENIGKEKFGVVVETEDKTEDGIAWCDEVFATGSTIVNETMPKYINSSKPVTFYGVTISAPARILKLNSYCHYGA